MTFFDRPPEPHRCQLPDVTTTSRYGWRCTCGEAYVRTLASQHGESWWQWERAPQHDLTPVPPQEG